MPKALRALGIALIVGFLAAWWLARGSEQPTSDCPSREAPDPASTSAGSPARPDPVLSGSAPTGEEGAGEKDGLLLTGRVLHAETRSPVTGAKVVIRSLERPLGDSVTGSDGRFQLTADALRGMPPGTPLLLVVAAPQMATLHAAPPGPNLQSSIDLGDLLLEPCSSIRGVVHGENQEIVPGARIVVEPARPTDGAEHPAGPWEQVGWRHETVSDDEGAFEFLGVPNRSFDLQVKGEGYVSTWLRGQTRPGATWIDVILRCGRSIQVRVEREDGQPVAGATVNLYRGYRTVFVGPYKTHLRLDRSTVSDEDGRCVLTGLMDRNYQITAKLGPLAGVASYVLSGWSEVVVQVGPGWRSTRYVYEGGPGQGASSGFFSSGVPGSPFHWHLSPPRPAEAEEDPSPTPDASGDVDDEPQDESEEEPPPPPDRARIHVTVLSADGVPIPRVLVDLEGPEEEYEITENDGTDVFHVAPGRYTYRASHVEFGTPAADVHGTLDAKGGAESHFEIRMPRVFSVPVQVQDHEGVPLPSTRLEILRGEKTEREWTDRSGRDLLFAERGQPFSILALPPNRPAALVENIVAPVKEPVRLVSPASRSLRGRVFGPNGAPLFGARVRAERAGLAPLGEESWAAWTDDTGYFILEGPGAALYDVQALHSAFGADAARVRVGEQQGLLVFRLQPMPRVRGRLLDGDGAPIPGAEIEIEGKSRGWVGSGDDGRFEIAFPAGEKQASLRVTHRDYAPKVVSVTPGDDRDLEIELSRAE